MRPVAFYLDSSGARDAQTSLEAAGIPSTIISTPLKEGEDAASGYRLLVEELYFDEAETILNGRKQAFVNQVENLLKQREALAAQKAADEATAKLFENRFWYRFAAAVALAIVATALLS